MQKPLSPSAPLHPGTASARRAEWYPVQGFAGLPLSRDKVLARFRAMANGSPVALAAFDWAERSGITFVNDLTKRHAAAEYLVGSGVILLSWFDLRNPALRFEMLNTGVHEIRHAWQDYSGLDARLNAEAQAAVHWRDAMFQTAMLEADAYAHGNLAERQARGLAATPGAFMRHAFWQWLDEQAEYYASLQLEDYLESCEDLSLFNIKRLYFPPDIPAHAERPGIDPFRHEDRAKLGRMFGGGNYMPWIDPVRLHKTTLSGAFAHAMYAHDMPTNAEEVMAVRRDQLQEQLRTQRKRLPLPG